MGSSRRSPPVPGALYSRSCRRFSMASSASSGAVLGVTSFVTSSSTTPSTTLSTSPIRLLQMPSLFLPTSCRARRYSPMIASWSCASASWRMRVGRLKRGPNRFSSPTTEYTRSTCLWRSSREANTLCASEESSETRCASCCVETAPGAAPDSLSRMRSCISSIVVLQPMNRSKLSFTRSLSWLLRSATVRLSSSTPCRRSSAGVSEWTTARYCSGSNLSPVGRTLLRSNLDGAAAPSPGSEAFSRRRRRPWRLMPRCGAAAAGATRLDECASFCGTSESDRRSILPSPSRSALSDTSAVRELDAASVAVAALPRLQRRAAVCLSSASSTSAHSTGPSARYSSASSSPASPPSLSSSSSLEETDFSLRRSAVPMDVPSPVGSPKVEPSALSSEDSSSSEMSSF
mmetsp:Transcript_36678/g.87120  ORF Transcript_36678/g.87120 Transcript_36678/m.87120 type:complete len:403 (-) Transcript_36678:119-1327(-)